MAMPKVGPTHSVSVAAAVIDASGRLLAIRRRDNGRWEPPGGVLELDETIGEGLVREVLEETGLTVEPEALTGVYKNMRRGIIALVFRCRVVDGQVGQVGVSAEAAKVAWLSAEEVAERMDEAYAMRLLDALRPGPPAVRAHDGLVLLPI
jgi:8-oxo-dGTP diphosphatase